MYSFKMLRRASLDDLEQASCELAPIVQQRIIQIQDEDHYKHLLLKSEYFMKNSVITETEEE